jgi:hypothetical protein
MPIDYLNYPGIILFHVLRRIRTRVHGERSILGVRNDFASIRHNESREFPDARGELTLGKFIDSLGERQKPDTRRLGVFKLGFRYLSSH